MVPARKGIVLDMRPLNEIKVNIDDGYVEANAGATLEEVNRELKKYGFFFPPDPSSVSISTVGGAINENSGGMRCARYGVVKDWVLKSVKKLFDPENILNPDNFALGGNYD